MAGENGRSHAIDQVLFPTDVINVVRGTLNQALGLDPVEFEPDSTDVNPHDGENSRLVGQGRPTSSLHHSGTARATHPILLAAA